MRTLAGAHKNVVLETTNGTAPTPTFREPAIRPYRGFLSYNCKDALHFRGVCRRLEHRVCGDRKVDVAKLKEHTECSSERLKGQLFEILESFNNEQMQRFLRQADVLNNLDAKKRAHEVPVQTRIAFHCI